MKFIVRQCLGLLAFLVFAGSYAYGDDIVEWGDATLTICNKGSVYINVVVALEADLWPLVKSLDVSGWTSIAPGDCKLVYNERGTRNNGATHAYIGFGFADSQGHITGAGHIERVPDFGWLGFTKVLIKSDRRLCVRNEGMSYTLRNDPGLDCASFHSDGNDRGGYVPLASALYFIPKPSWCKSMSGVVVSCGGGEYYLNVKPTANDRELHASAGSKSGKDQSPADAGIGIGDILKALAKAEEENRKKPPVVPMQTQMAARDQEDNRKRWAAPHQSPASYDPQWMEQDKVVTGTVSRVEVTPGRPPWVTIYFKESPDATFVVCSPYPNMFQARVGLDLSVLVGKTLQAAGQVESPYCGNKVPKASIRVVDSKGWQVQ